MSYPAIGSVPAAALPPPDAVDLLPEPAQSSVTPDLGGPLHHAQYAPHRRPAAYVVTWSTDANGVHAIEAHYRQHVTTRQWPLQLRCGLDPVQVTYSGPITTTWTSNKAARVVALVTRNGL